MLARIASQWRFVFTTLLLVALAAFALTKGVSVLAGDRGVTSARPRQTIPPQAAKVLEASTSQPGQGVPAEPAAALQVTQPTPRPPSGTTYHTVQKGETLRKIAAQYGVTTSALVTANGISNPNLIRIGQRLVIPSR